MPSTKIYGDTSQNSVVLMRHVREIVFLKCEADVIYSGLYSVTDFVLAVLNFRLLLPQG